jgi:hypothetical protein
METQSNEKSASRMTSVLTDIQFWIPVAVLLGGLALLHLLR